MPGLRLSVVVPVKDDAALLRRCLEALRMQTRRADQTIVVDNGSSDDSGDVARAAGATVVREPTPGIAAASARGYDVADGDVLLRLDADSVPPVDWVQRIGAAFEADPGLDALTGPGFFTDLTPARRTIGAMVYMAPYFGAIRLALGIVPLYGSNMAVRATAWRS